jgi:YidC/Oxa1 family membrane protein insertase
MWKGAVATESRFPSPRPKRGGLPDVGATGEKVPEQVRDDRGFGGFGRLLAAALLIFAALPAAAQSSENLVIELTDRPEQGTAAWSVALPASSSAKERWRSLISTDEAGERISRHLAFSLPGVSGWQQVGTGRGGEPPASAWLSSDGRWRLYIELSSADQPWWQDLDISLDAVEAAKADALALQIGPGIGETPMAGLGIARSLYSYTDAVAYRNETVFRLTPDAEDAPSELGPGDWAGLHSRYFALLTAPLEGPETIGLQAGREADIDSLPADYLPWIRLQLPVGELPAGETLRWRLAVFSGPKTQAALSPGGAAVDHSPLLFNGLWNWMRALSLGLLWVLQMIHALIPSWGLAICLLAVLVRLLLYPLGRWALASQQRFSEVQAEIAPKVREIKQRYKGGEQSERILQLYESRGVSPLAGLKPLLIVLIQIPVFVALFHVLGQVFEFRDASFLWIDSLAEPDRLFYFGVDLPFFGAWFNLLPVLMALSTLVTMKLAPAPAASAAERRRQNIFLGLMALVFFLLFYPFPSGMVLYWTVANLLHVAQSRLARPSSDTEAA